MVTDEKFLELSNKVAVLEERTVNDQKQLQRIEDKLVNHADNEEELLRHLNNSLVEFKDTIEEKIDSSVNPIQNELSRYKGILKGVGWILSGIVVVLGFMKDALIAYFTSR